MMSFWVRELAGWVLLGLGLYGFILVYDFCERHYIFEAWVLLIGAIFLFRGGIHLLKVAIAARVCQQVQQMQQVQQAQQVQQVQQVQRRQNTDRRN